MSTKHNIHTLDDMLNLSREEFQRMLPDLILWFDFAKPIHGMPGVRNAGFEWSDDGENTITGADLIDPATGKKTEIRS